MTSITEQEAWRNQAEKTQQAEETSLRREALLSWISASDPIGRHQTLLGAHHSGTDEWFMKGVDFTEWIAGDFNNLWLYGIGAKHSGHM